MGTRPKKPQGRVHTRHHTPKSFDFHLLAMFTAGNMTYMRKRKKERQAAKRAMAREMPFWTQWRKSERNRSRSLPMLWRRNQLGSTTCATTEASLSGGHTPQT